MVRIFGFMLAMVLILSAASVSAQEIEFTVSVNKPEVALDDQLHLTLSVTGDQQNLPTASLNSSTIPNFRILGQSTSQNISIVNGKMEAQRDTRIVLLPEKEGVFKIGPFQLTHDGQTYRSNSVQVTVKKAGSSTSRSAQQNEQELIFLDVIFDKNEAYLHEQVTLTYFLYFRVNVTGLEYEQLPTTTGFWAEELDVPKDRNGNFTIEQKVLDGVRYNRVMVRKMALFPSTIGELTVGPMMLKTNVRARSNDPFDSFFNFGRTQQKVVRAPEVKIQVKALPTAGQPANFNGLVGNYDIETQIDKTNLPANEAATLKVTISGSGKIQAIEPPELNLPSDITRHDSNVTENVDRSSSQVRGSKTFEFVLIPRYEGDYTLDPLQLSYFDPKQERYESISTQPITLTVTESLTDEPQFVYMGGGKEKVTLANRDIRFIKDVASLSDEGEMIYRHPLYWVAMGVPFVLFGLVVGYRRRLDKIESDSGYARKLRASRQAKKLFANANKALKANDREAFYSAVAHALTAFIADKWNLPPAAVTADTAESILTERHVADETVAQVVSCLNTCNFARFAPASPQQAEEMNQILKDAQQCVTQLDRHRN